jgi:hypothetical protein
MCSRQLGGGCPHTPFFEHTAASCPGSSTDTPSLHPGRTSHARVWPGPSIAQMEQWNSTLCTARMDTGPVPSYIRLDQNRGGDSEVTSTTDHVLPFHKKSTTYLLSFFPRFFHHVFGRFSVRGVRKHHFKKNLTLRLALAPPHTHHMLCYPLCQRLKINQKAAARAAAGGGARSRQKQIGDPRG